MIFDDEWIRNANEVLARHHTGAVPEFEVTATVFDSTRSGVPDFSLEASNSRVRFVAGHLSAVDVQIAIAGEVLRKAFAFDEQHAFVEAAMADGSLFVQGDLAKARFFYTGLVRNASKETVRALRAL